MSFETFELQDQPTRVVLIDDEKEVRELLARALQKFGCEVLDFGSGEAALMALEEREVDLVVSDIKMRGMDGVEVLRRVREKYPIVEVILVTGDATVDAAIQALRHGAYDLLLKPIRLEHLAQVIHRCQERLHYARENRELRRVVDRLTELNNRKEKFVAVANHELRTPTTIVAGLISMLKKRTSGMDPTAVELLARTDEAMERLRTVVREIGELATAHSFEQWIKPTKTTVKSIGNGLKLLAIDYGELRELDISVYNNVDEGVIINADYSKIIRAVAAIMQNAVKYTPDGGSIKVELKQEGDKVMISVADNGVGVSKGEAEKIFDLFYSAGEILHHHTSDHEFGGGGLGVGLYLARTIAEAHGGTVTYAPNKGGGSVFTLELSVLEG